MASNGSGWVHGGHNYDSLKTHEVKVSVIEALVANDLLEERNQLDGFILVRLGQVDVF